MYTEYEATFEKIDKDKVRQSLEEQGAKLIKPEFVMKRVTFDLPSGEFSKWARVRDEGDRITMSFKSSVTGDINKQKEIELKVDDFEAAVEFLEVLGCKKRAYQENKRELWILDDVEVSIDEWPYLEPFVEIEGKSEDDVKRVSEKLGFDYEKALFCSIDHLYSRKYGLSEEYICQEIDKIIFDDSNPFIIK